jgi:hypothetical protein
MTLMFFRKGNVNQSFGKTDKIYNTKMTFKLFYGLVLATIVAGILFCGYQKMTKEKLGVLSGVTFFLAAGIFIFISLVILNIICLKIVFTEKKIIFYSSLPSLLNVFRIPKVFSIQVPIDIEWSDIATVEYLKSFPSSLLYVKTRSGKRMKIPMVSAAFDANQVIKQMGCYISAECFNSAAKEIIFKK